VEPGVDGVTTIVQLRASFTEATTTTIPPVEGSVVGETLKRLM
jgi:hypothetical protein